MTNFQILRAEPRDAETLNQVTLASKAHWGYPAEWMEKWTSVLRTSPEYIQAHLTMKAVFDGQVVGYYALIAYDNVAWLDSLFILPEFMGKGLGRSLFEHALAQCRSLNRSRMEWESDPHAADFYRHIGAQQVGNKTADYGRTLPVFTIDVPE